jgi:DNA-directed RNA polymerase alpha subunit
MPENPNTLGGGHPARRRRAPAQRTTPQHPVEIADALARAQAERLAQPLAETQLSVRTINTLESAGILTIEELVKKDLADIQTLANFGDRATKEVLRVFTEMGIYVTHWGMKPPKGKK